MKKTSLLIAFVLLSALSAFPQDTSYVRHIIKELSSQRMYGRGASYHGDSVAAAFLADQLAKLGVRPLSPGYLQHYRYSCYTNEGPLSLTINGDTLTPFSHYRIYPSKRHLQKRLESASWKKQLKDGTWLIGVNQLDTYSPIVGELESNPVFVEVLDSLIPKRVKKVDLHLPLQYRENYRSQNVVGYVPGIIDSMVVFTAHYDHCGIMGDGIYFPGAHDNASGSAAVLDLARMATLQKPYYTMVFMLFSGEESGLTGSRHAAQNPLIDYSKVKLLCNIDMFCGGDEGLMVFNATADNTQPFVNRLIAANEQSHAAQVIKSRENSPNSDHYYFSSLCPSIFILTMGQRYGGYHNPADTCQACGLDHYNDFIKLILSIITD